MTICQQLPTVCQHHTRASQARCQPTTNYTSNYSVFHKTKPPSPLLVNGEQAIVLWNILWPQGMLHQQVSFLSCLFCTTPELRNMNSQRRRVWRYTNYKRMDAGELWLDKLHWLYHSRANKRGKFQNPRNTVSRSHHQVASLLAATSNNHNVTIIDSQGQNKFMTIMEKTNLKVLVYKNMWHYASWSFPRMSAAPNKQWCVLNTSDS